MNSEGFRKRVNVYTCEKCGGKTTTIDRDTGVTPFMLMCRASGRVGDCDGYSYSCMYQPPRNHAEPEWEWYIPGRGEIKRMTQAERQHVEQGGLSLRKIRGEDHPDLSMVPIGYYRSDDGVIRKVS